MTKIATHCFEIMIGTQPVAGIMIDPTVKEIDAMARLLGMMLGEYREAKDAETRPHITIVKLTNIQ